MPTLDPSELQSQLRETNRKLRVYLKTVLSSHHFPEALSQAVGREQVQDLLKKLEQADSAQPGHLTLCEYRELLVQVRDILPSIHNELLSERDRMQQQSEHLRSVSDWMRSSSQIL
jgi:thiamine kinase-like enzyme